MFINEFGCRDNPTFILLAPMMVSGTDLYSACSKPENTVITGQFVPDMVNRFKEKSKKPQKTLHLETARYKRKMNQTTCAAI